MNMIRFIFFIPVLGGVLILNGCTEPPKEAKAQETPVEKVEASSKDTNSIDTKVEMESVDRQAQITATSSNGLVIVAKNNYNHTWGVTGDNAVGGIIHVDPTTNIATYKSSSMSAPIQSMTVDPNGNISTTMFNSFGSKKSLIVDSSKNLIQVEVINSPKEMLLAKKGADGVWDITGSDAAGKSIKGSLKIDQNTDFIAYKGTNGSFMYTESVPIDSVIAGMSLVKGPLTEKSIEKELADVSDKKTGSADQVQDLILSIISKIGKL